MNVATNTNSALRRVVGLIWKPCCWSQAASQLANRVEHEWRERKMLGWSPMSQ
jgi:hypothetical protein